MENEGYKIQPFILPACAVGAPHRRDRCWFVAHCADAGVETMREGQNGIHAAGNASDADRDRCRIRTHQPESVSGGGRTANNCDGGSNGYVADTEDGRLSIAGATWRRRSGFKNGRIIPNWEDFPTQPPVYRRDDGLPFDVDGITFPKWRNQSIKAYGNAIVPQVALQIFETINKYEKLWKHAY